MGQHLNMGALFRVVFPTLIAILTLVPFLGSVIGSLAGFLAIVCYCVCAMLFYVFLIREGRRLDLSSTFLAVVYMVGSSGCLVVGLCVGLALNAVSASFDLQLLTLLAFAAIYPLALVLAFLMHRGKVPARADTPRRTFPDEVAAPVSRSQAVASVAMSCGLTKRESEILTYLARGCSAHYIAEALVISENTVWTHIKRIYAKTGAHGKDELMRLVEAQAKDTSGHPVTHVSR